MQLIGNKFSEAKILCCSSTNATHTEMFKSAEMGLNMKYKRKGLETHVELITSKISVLYHRNGGDPNTHCCPICIGLPGTLPKLNKEVVRYAIRAGLATNCEINRISKMDRKNYCYPDLSKAYQISQYDQPLCKNGYIELSNGRRIRLNRIHIERRRQRFTKK